MTLAQLLSTLKTANVTVSIADLTTGDEIVSIKAAGYANLDDALEARQVEQWFINGPTSIKVVIASATAEPQEP